jgi:allantoate deiminase
MCIQWHSGRHAGVSGKASLIVYIKGDELKMKISIERIKKDLDSLSQFTADERGITRVAYSKEERQARDYLIEEIRKMNLPYYEDGFSTIFVRKEGRLKNAPCVMTGSHFDTVYHGGRFDGTVGVICAMEVMRVLLENGFENDYPIELILMNAEEGSIFGPSTGVANSRAMMGTLTDWELDNTRNREGKTKREALREYGCEADLTKAKRDPETIKNFIELHIEQGPNLERHNKEIGIVEFLGGIGRYYVRFKGNTGDSTMLMKDRNDALVAASYFSVRLDSVIKEMGDDVTGMMGQLNIIPNSSQFVPEFVEGKIEIRTFTKEIVDKYDYPAIIKSLLKETEEKYGISTELEEIRRINYSNPTYPSIFNKEVTENIRKICEDLGYSYMYMHNGTGHDSMIMADHVDTNMIYIPSRNDGVSHCPEEFTELEDIEKGANVLLHLIMDLSKS